MKSPSTLFLLLKKLFREVKANWKQFLSILFIGGIAVTLFVGLEANADSIASRVNETYTRGNMADIWVTTSSYAEEDEARLETISGGDVEGRVYTTATLEGAASYLIARESLPTISKPWEIVESGATLTSEDFFLYDEAFLTPSAARDLVIKVGDEVNVVLDLPLSEEQKTAISDLLSPFLLDGVEDPFLSSNLVLHGTVNGAMKYPENINKASYNRSAFLISYSRLSDMFVDFIERTYDVGGLLDRILEELGIPGGILPDLPIGDYLPSLSTILDFLSKYIEGGIPLPYQYCVKLDEGADPDKVMGDIDAYFEGKGEGNNLVISADRYLMPFSSSMQMEVDNARSLTYVFPFVFFFVALLVILTTTSQIIIKERTQIGAMKAIGVSEGLIYLHYVMLVGFVVLLGTILGEILGPIIIPFVMDQKYSILYTLPARAAFPFPLAAGLLTAVVFLLVSALVTILVSYKTVRLSPSSSLRPETPSFKGKGRVSKKTPKATFLSLKIAIRNIRTNLVKSLMVIVGVAGCTALLVCGFGIEDTINNGVSKDLGNFFNSDLEVSYLLPQKPEDVEAGLLPIEGIQEYDNIYMGSVQAYNSDGMAVDERLIAFERDDNHFKIEIPTGTVAISNKVSRELGLGLGDEVTFVNGGTEVTAEIGNVFEAFTANAIFASASLPGVFQEGQESYSMTFVYLEDGYDEGKVREEILDQYKAAIGVMTHDERETQVEDIVGGILVMTNAVKVFAVLLALVVLINLALLNFRERTRDIATLKVLGFSKWEIGLSLLLESMLLTSVGVALGMVLGFPFMYGVLIVNVVPLVDFLYYISPLTYVLAFVLTFLVALAVNFYLSLLTKKVKMVESLKSVE